MASSCSWDSAVEVHGAAALAIARVVLKTGGVATARGLLDPGLLWRTEVVTAAPAVAALLTKLLLAEAIGTPLGCSWLNKNGGGGDCGRGNGKESEKGFHCFDGQGREVNTPSSFWVCRPDSRGWLRGLGRGVA